MPGDSPWGPDNIADVAWGWVCLWRGGGDEMEGELEGKDGGVGGFLPSERGVDAGGI